MKNTVHKGKIDWMITLVPLILIIGLAGLFYFAERVE